MAETKLSLVPSRAQDQHGGRVTLLERKTALDALAEFAEQARNGEGRLVLLEGGSTNPYPVEPVPARSAGFWEVFP